MRPCEGPHHLNQHETPTQHDTSINMRLQPLREATGGDRAAGRDTAVCPPRCRTRICFLSTLQDEILLSVHHVCCHSTSRCCLRKLRPMDRVVQCGPSTAARPRSAVRPVDTAVLGVVQCPSSAVRPVGVVQCGPPTAARRPSSAATTVPSTRQCDSAAPSCTARRPSSTATRLGSVFD